MGILDWFTISTLLSSWFEFVAGLKSWIVVWRLSGRVGVWIDESSKQLIFWGSKAFILIRGVLVTQLIVDPLTEVLGASGSSSRLLACWIHGGIGCVKHLLMTARAISLLLIVVKGLLLMRSSMASSSSVSLGESWLYFITSPRGSLSRYEFPIRCLLLLLLLNWNASFTRSLQAFARLWSCNRYHRIIAIGLWLVGHIHSTTWLKAHGWLYLWLLIESKALMVSHHWVCVALAGWGEQWDSIYGISGVSGCSTW